MKQNFHNSLRFFIIVHHSFQGSHPKVSTPKNCSELVLNYMIKYNKIKRMTFFTNRTTAFGPTKTTGNIYYHHWIEVKVA